VKKALVVQCERGREKFCGGKRPQAKRTEERTVPKARTNWSSEKSQETKIKKDIQTSQASLALGVGWEGVYRGGLGR